MVVLPQETPEAQSYLGDPNIRSVFNRLVAICVNQVIYSGASIERLELTTKRSQEERWIELVLRVVVSLNIPQSLALWDAIGEAIQRWSGYLPARQSSILTDRLAVFVEPSAVHVV